MAAKKKNAKETGELSIETENLFPIIKKWLYSEKDIFLRELVANSLDAITKLQKIISFGDYSGSIEPLIRIKADTDKGTLTVSDNGLGMTREEIGKYINQIAFSGIEDFVKKYQEKDEKDQIIGFFGVGFYSTFMVSSKVEIISRSYQKGATAVKWSCEGTTKYSLEPAEREEVGTDVILYLDDENKDYLKKYEIKKIISTHCQFLPVPIEFEDEKINEPDPLWNKSPSEVTDDDYKKFYRDLYGTFEEPLFWIHLNVDYPFELKGILYFPKLKREMEAPGQQ
ncbi:MAG: molecular chaperone HtpG, partial [bacterium]|nr:molecular chaperone HtpG [bacterium]